MVGVSFLALIVVIVAIVMIAGIAYQQRFGNWLENYTVESRR